MVRIIISCDQTPVPTEVYQEYVKKLEAFGGVIQQESHVGVGMVAKAGLLMVDTDLVFLCEHDFEIIRDVPFSDIEKVFTVPEVKYLRLNRWVNVEQGCDTYMIPVCDGKVPALKTGGWSAHPHFARMDWYRDFIFPKIVRAKGRYGLETQVHPQYIQRQREIGFDLTFKEYGTCVYGRIGDPPVVFHFGGDRIRGKLGKPHCC
jgi:hypothetical protein